MKTRLREALLVTLAAAAFYTAAHISSVPPRVQSPTDLLGVFQPFEPPPGNAVQNSLLLDAVLQFAPWLQFSRAELLAGRLPTWNPGQGLGTVHLANDQSAVFSLWSLPYYILGPYGLFFAGLGKALALCLGLYCFLRDEGLGRRAALAAGLALTASGPVVAWQLHCHTGAFAWVGFTLFFAGRAVRSEHVVSRWTLGLAAVTAATLVAGHAQLALQVALITGVWTLVCSGRRAHSEGMNAGLRGLVQAILGACAGLGLASIHLLPFAAALADSEALQEHSGTAASVKVPVRLMAMGLFPDLYGSPRDGFLDREVLGNPSYLEQVGPYAGAALLVLALLGLCAGTFTRRRRLVLTFGGVAVVGLLVVYGPLADVFASTPPFSLTRNHRLTFLVALSLCVLGATGFDRVLRKEVPAVRAGWIAVALVGVAYAVTRGAPEWSTQGAGRAGRGLTFTVAVPMLGAFGALAVASLRSRLGQQRSGALLGAVVALELLGFAYDFAPGSARDSLPPPLPALAVARGQRLIAVGARVMPANTGLYYGVHQVNAYDALGNTSVRPQLMRLAPFQGALQGTLFFDDRVADALSVRWVLTDDPFLARNLRRGLSGWLPGSQGYGGRRVAIPEGGVGQDLPLGTDPITVIALPDVECEEPTLLSLKLEAGTRGMVLAEASVQRSPGTGEVLFRFPRVFLPGGRATITVTSDPLGARVLYSREDRSRGHRLHAGRQARGDLTFMWAAPVSAPYEEVASWGGRSWLLRNPDARSRASLQHGEGTVVITAETPTEITLAVDAETSATLILADAYALGWEATVDGVPVPVDDAAGLRAVKVPAGKSKVTFVYAPASVRTGAALSLASLVLCGLAGLVIGNRGRSHA